MVNELNTESESKMDNEFKVGDGVSWSLFSDRFAGTVVKVTRCRVHVVEDDAKLLNGPNSGEEDALQVHPGGFCANVQGNQRYEYSRGSGRSYLFTLRNDKKRRYDSETKQWNDVVEQEFRLKSANGYGSLSHGRTKHYDYNF